MGPEIQMGEKGQEEDQQGEAALRRPVPPVHVDEIARRHEQVEGDTHRQDQLRRCNGAGAARQGQQPLGQGECKGEVFEEKQGAEEEKQSQDQNSPPAPLGAVLQQPCARIGHQGCAQQEEKTLHPRP